MGISLGSLPHGILGCLPPVVDADTLRNLLAALTPEEGPGYGARGLFSELLSRLVLYSRSTWDDVGTVWLELCARRLDSIAGHTSEDMRRGFRASDDVPLFYVAGQLLPRLSSSALVPLLRTQWRPIENRVVRVLTEPDSSSKDFGLWNANRDALFLMWAAIALGASSASSPTTPLRVEESRLADRASQIDRLGHAVLRVYGESTASFCESIRSRL